MNIEKFVSADGHLGEPLDLWVSRMDKRFRDRAPQFASANGQMLSWSTATR